MSDRTSAKDKPWIFRTYAGHSTAGSEQALSPIWPRGQTGLSIAFDLPTQTGYDSDHILAAAKSARSACRYRISATCATLFDGIPSRR